MEQLTEQLTEQQIFSRVWTHLHTQGEPARSQGGGACMYLTDDGKRCAMGVFIPQERYHGGLEDTAVDMLGNELLSECGLAGVPIKFLLELQRIHDAYKPSDWLPAVDRRLREFSRDHKLTIPEPAP